ncbi:MAG: hypothetical protein P8X70_03055 [Nanoarchaeota archaeon]
MEDKSIKEKRIRNITQLYYARPDIQKAIFEFCKNREVVPRYFEGFGKRPDSLEYPGDIFELVKRGATSFHCSEEIWKNPLEIKTGMQEPELNSLRNGWDLLMDIDSKYIDYSKIMAELIIEFLNFHGVKNIGIKFSGSKGFHIIVPWKAFPREINGISISDKFPEYPRIIVKYILEKITKKLIDKVSELQRPNKYIKDFQAPKEVVPDLVLVSSRHLFRTPYSLHEKTALASVVLSTEELKNFEMKDANPFKIKIKKFTPESEENEASELLMQALDWHNQEVQPETLSQDKKISKNFQPLKIKNLNKDNLPPCIKIILKGLSEGNIILKVLSGFWCLQSR